uniref:Uncharacterized protein n=1 Tax=Cucumis melo TaxID=3656 RepID=A0A9I9E5Z1_CUCME
MSMMMNIGLKATLPGLHNHCFQRSASLKPFRSQKMAVVVFFAAGFLLRTICKKLPLSLGSDGNIKSTYGRIGILTNFNKNFITSVTWIDVSKY